MDSEDRLLAYMQDRLDPQARAEFEAHLDANPDVRGEIAMLRAAGQALGAHDLPRDAAADGWARLSHSIDAERMPTPANENRGLALLKMAGLVAASIAVWQVAVVPQLRPTGGGLVPASVTTAGPVLRVAFAQEAALAEVTELLRTTGARVSDGPGAIGLFTLTFADLAALEAAEAAFAARPELVVAVSRP